MTLDVGLWTFGNDNDNGLWTLDLGLSAMDFGLTTNDSRLWTIDRGLTTIDFGLTTNISRLITIFPHTFQYNSADTPQT